MWRLLKKYQRDLSNIQTKMGRPPRYDNDSLLDAAVALSAGGGPQAVTMAAVIAAAGAPSGSLYHRFPNRPALQAALWLRTLERFQAGFLEAVAAEDGLLAALGAAAHTIAWSRAHHEEARVLLYGAADFGCESWPAPERARLASRQADVATAIDALAEKLSLRGSARPRTRGAGNRRRPPGPGAPSPDRGRAGAERGGEIDRARRAGADSGLGARRSA